MGLIYTIRCKITGKLYERTIPRFQQRGYAEQAGLLHAEQGHDDLANKTL